jgi:hypothetical protein
MSFEVEISSQFGEGIREMGILMPKALALILQGLHPGTWISSE